MSTQDSRHAVAVAAMSLYVNDGQVVSIRSQIAEAEGSTFDILWYHLLCFLCSLLCWVWNTYPSLHSNPEIMNFNAMTDVCANTFVE